MNNNKIKIGTMLMNAVKELLSDESGTDQTSAPESKIISYKLNNGVIVNIKDELKNGSIVTDADGKPFADGEHRLEDNALLRVEKGIITEYLPAPKSNEKPEDNKTQNVETPEMVEAKKQMIELNKSIEALQTQLKEITEKFNTQNKVNLELTKQLEVIGGQPSQKPIVPNDQPNANAGVPDDPYERDRYFTKKAQERLIAMKKAK